MNGVTMVISLVLGVVFFVAGLMKCNPKTMNNDFERFGFPKWFKYVSGIIEIISGLLALYGIVQPTAAVLGAGLIAITMVGALYSQLKVGDSFKELLFPLIVLGFSLLIVILHWQHFLIF